MVPMHMTTGRGEDEQERTRPPRAGHGDSGFSRNFQTHFWQRRHDGSPAAVLHAVVQDGAARGGDLLQLLTLLAQVALAAVVLGAGSTFQKSISFLKQMGQMPFFMCTSEVVDLNDAHLEGVRVPVEVELALPGVVVVAQGEDGVRSLRPGG